MDCSPSLDQAAGLFRASSGQRGREKSVTWAAASSEIVMVLLHHQCFSPRSGIREPGKYLLPPSCASLRLWFCKVHKVEEWLVSRAASPAVDMLARLEKQGSVGIEHRRSQVPDRFGKVRLRTVQLLVKKYADSVSSGF
jgi:hypothetical protein